MNSAQESRAKKGLASKIFGSALFFIGCLNLIMNYRSGIPFDYFQLVLISLGVGSLIIGIIKGRG